MATVEERVDPQIIDTRCLWQNNQHMTSLAQRAIQEIDQRLQGEKNALSAVTEIRNYLADQYDRANTTCQGIAQELLLRRPKGIRDFMHGLENEIRKFPPCISTNPFSGVVELEELKRFLFKTLVVFRDYSDRPYKN